MSIRFDMQGMVNALRRELIEAMKQLQQELLNEAKQGMLTREGAESLKNEEIEDIAKVITAAISGGAWAAMDEWGTGHMMDTSNPAYREYVNSPYWNPLRQGDNYIRGRPKGSYTDIFGNQRYSSGRAAGRIIEYPKGPYVVHPPSHAIQTAARWMANGRMQRVIKLTLEAFPFGNYIITDQR